MWWPTVAKKEYVPEVLAGPRHWLACPLLNLPTVGCFLVLPPGPQGSRWPQWAQPQVKSGQEPAHRRLLTSLLRLQALPYFRYTCTGRVCIFTVLFWCWCEAILDATGRVFSRRWIFVFFLTYLLASLDILSCSWKSRISDWITFFFHRKKILNLKAKLEKMDFHIDWLSEPPPGLLGYGLEKAHVIALSWREVCISRSTESNRQLETLNYVQ